MKKCLKDHLLSNSTITDPDISNMDLFKDPYLIPYKDIISKRIDFIKKREKSILHSSHSSLYAFSNYHNIYGLHKKTNNTWIFKEWAPNADAIYIIGDMTNWKKNIDFRLENNTNDGTFSKTFPENTFEHNQHYKLLLISKVMNRC